ncbi:MAG: hypothetical protein ACFFDT_27925, partial [Candidatus Hodarchaeota archaeon]
KDRMKRDFLFIWLFSLLMIILAQNKLMGHHFVLLSPVIALFAGYGGYYLISIGHLPIKLLKINLNRSQIIACIVGAILITTTINIGVWTYILYLEPDHKESPEYMAATILKTITNVEDIVISGNPEISLFADRFVPPELADIAENRYPELTDQYLIDRTVENNVTAVVIAYRLFDYLGYLMYLEEDYTRDLSAWNIDPLILQDLEEQDILIYVKSDLLIL